MRPKILLPALTFFLCSNTFASEPCWQTTLNPNALIFISTQGKTTIEGEFQQYQGDICLNSVSMENNQIEIIINTTSAFTDSSDLNEALQSPDFFDTAKWPQATFHSNNIQPLGNNRYNATGELTLKNITHVIQVPFTLSPSSESDSAILQGNASINRLDFDVGQGQWRSDEWADNAVTIQFNIQLTTQK